MNKIFRLEECRRGRFLVPPTDAVVGKSVATYGEHAEGVVQTLEQVVTDQTRVVVVGAGFGTVAVPIAACAGEVVCFEPQRWVAQLCAANAVLNDRVNVRVYWAAVGAARATAYVPVLDPGKANNFGGYDLKKMVVGEREGDAVPVYPLDALPDVDCGVLVIEAPGAVHDVLLGAAAMIARVRPLVVFDGERETERKMAVRFMMEHDYLLYWTPSPMYNPENVRAVSENVLVSAHTGVPWHHYYILAKPREADKLTMTGFELVKP